MTKKKSKFGSDFSSFDLHLSPQFFCVFFFLLNVIHCMQLQGKRMIQTQENSKKPHFGLILAQRAPIRATKFSIQKSDFVSH